jgi:nicotinamidase-related amidase
MAATPAPRMNRARCALLVVDVQEKLAPHVEGHEALIARAQALIAAADRLAMPVLATEHAAERIGPLVPGIRMRIARDAIYAKQRFGAMDEPAFAPWLRARERTQVAVCGMEAHVCVMQTALGIAAAGYEAFVVADAVGSRGERRTDRTLALARMREAGCVLVGSEMALFEWTRAADDEAFRDVLKLVKELPPA